MKKKASPRAGSLVLTLGGLVACWLIFTESAYNLAIFAVVVCGYTLWRLEKLERLLESNRSTADTPVENLPAILNFPPIAPTSQPEDLKPGKSQVA